MTSSPGLTQASMASANPPETPHVTSTAGDSPNSDVSCA